MLTLENVTSTVRSSLSSWLDAQPEELAGPMAEFLERRRMFDLPDAAFSDELRYPVLGLPLWTAQLPEIVDSKLLSTAAVTDICTAALFGYLHIRVIDDHVDEGVGSTAVTIALSNALLARANELLSVRAGSDERFWTYHRERLTLAAVATAAEVRSGNERRRAAEDFDALLDRAAPLTIPAAAIMSVTSSWTSLEQLEGFARSCAWGSQMLNDLRDVGKDLQHDRVTWAAVRILTPGPEGRVPNFEAERQILDETLLSFRRAATAAREIGLGGGAEWADAAAEQIRILRASAPNAV